MKKINVLQLIASLCFLFGNTITLVNTFTEIPVALSICSLLLLLASIILYCIVLKRRLKEKNQDEKKKTQKN